MRWAKLGYLGAVSAAFIVACSSSSSSGGGGNNCPNVSGLWSLSGTCLDTACNISQSGCTVSLSCSPSGDVYQGTVNGSSISFGDGTTSCSGSLATQSGSGSCNDPTAGSCQWAASCQSGACATSGTGGGSGTGGSSGIDCNASCNSITSCCSQMTMSSCIDGCTSQPNTSAACLNCFNNTSCGSFVPCIVANCGVPGSLCPSAPTP